MGSRERLQTGPSTLSAGLGYTTGATGQSATLCRHGWRGCCLTGLGKEHTQKMERTHIKLPMYDANTLLEALVVCVWFPACLLVRRQPVPAPDASRPTRVPRAISHTLAAD